MKLPYINRKYFIAFIICTAITLIFQFILPEKAADDIIKYFIGGLATGSFISMFIVKSNNSD